MQVEGTSFQVDPEEQQTLHVDGSSSSSSSGSGLILAYLEEDIVKYALRFGFSTINNEAEYNTLIAKLKIAKQLGVGYLTIFSDFQLVAGQVKGEYEA